jgi:hypothetical protein
MTTDTSANSEQAQPDHRHGPEVVVNDTPLAVKDPAPTPRNLLQLSGHHPATEFVLIHWPSSGATRELALDEPFELLASPNRFFAFAADGAHFFTLDDVRFEWGRFLSVNDLRRVGGIDPTRALFMDEQGRPDRELKSEDTLDLQGAGVERFYSRARVWELDIQGERFQWPAPTITVREALIKAKFDVTKPWIITLKVKDKAKEKVGLDDVIDLRQPGIERLRVLKGEVTNGDGMPGLSFPLLPKDEAWLSENGYTWRTMIEGANRWLLLEHFPLPAKFNVNTCTLAVNIPEAYPAAQLDMFFCCPALSRLDGVVIPQTQVNETIDGAVFQRWSRHPTAPWLPDEDSVRTHMALIDESLSREVEL